MKKITLMELLPFLLFGCSQSSQESIPSVPRQDTSPSFKEEETSSSVTPNISFLESTWTYKDKNDQEESLDYALYLPSSYSETKTDYPLITYIPDASYQYKKITQVEKAACVSHWINEENQKSNPSIFLILTLTKNSTTDSKEGDYLTALSEKTSEENQVLNIIDSVVSTYRIDKKRLYLTGQSLGGIFDFALNTVYPDKFAATVYVSCQPGGEIPDPENGVACEMYDEILKAKTFENQKFLYITSRKDGKANIGQDDIERILQEDGISYYKDYTLNNEEESENEKKLQELLRENPKIALLAFPEVNSGSNEHMKSFDPIYSLPSLYSWLLNQSL